MSGEGGSYELRVTGPAQRQLERLPEGTAAAIVEFMFSALVENPHRVGGRLQRELSGLYSARRGAYRVVYGSTRVSGRLSSCGWTTDLGSIPPAHHRSVSLRCGSRTADSGPVVALAWLPVGLPADSQRWNNRSISRDGEI